MDNKDSIMMKRNYTLVLIGLVKLMVIVFISVFTVNQRQIAIVFQLGEAVRTIVEPGLHIKIPFIQNLEFFDKRILRAEAESKELTAADGKRIIIDVFAHYIIVDPITFYKTVRDYQGISIRLNKILESSMRQVIGTKELKSLLTKERTDIMLKIQDIVSHETKDFGVQIIDVKILRADLPKENSSAIYRSMQTAREKEAKQIRAEGEEEASRIRSKADKESKIILAEAYMQAQIIKGEGDAEAAKTYNAAYSVDPVFYKFYKSLRTYEKVLKKDNTSFILSPNADFFKYLNIGK